ncbi:MAG: RNB domain-containing ribonuclease [Acidobacteriota bacterium]|nr:RNB domain-containing ribonuclease [Acidobacteriota bacterium]
MGHNGFDLAAAAYREMVSDGFKPDLPAGTTEQVEAIRKALAAPGGGAAGAAAPSGGAARDLRELLWSSIDNDTSRDLDQVEWAERIAPAADGTGGGIRVSVGIADVAGAVARGTPIDQHAAEQTKTIYTGVRNFPMLPNELSTGLTSLNQDEDRAAVVTEYVVDAQGCRTQGTVYRALLRNKAQLAYSKVGPWLEGKLCEGHLPCTDVKIAGSPELQAQLKLQDEAAQAMRAERMRNGAVDFRRIEADPLVVDGQVKAIQEAVHNRATELIEEFMVGANETMAETLQKAGRSCIRRVVRVPQRWDRIVELAKAKGTALPTEPDSAALSGFLQAQRTKDPVHYPDLSLAVIKLMGAGEYVLVAANDPEPLGHFGLAARDYAHSTAPNRRFPDLVVQRLIEALLDGKPAPYTDDELRAIATQCNVQEHASHKVERAMTKRVAAVALADKIGQRFHGVVTGAGDKGTYVRVFSPPVEGRIVQGEKGLDVGDQVDVKLIHTNPQMAFIDFARA